MVPETVTTAGGRRCFATKDFRVERQLRPARKVKNSVVRPFLREVHFRNLLRRIVC